jgi:hypothetical protein
MMFIALYRPAMRILIMFSSGLPILPIGIRSNNLCAVPAAILTLLLKVRRTRFHLRFMDAGRIGLVLSVRLAGTVEKTKLH